MEKRPKHIDIADQLLLDRIGREVRGHKMRRKGIDIPDAQRNALLDVGGMADLETLLDKRTPDPEWTVTRVLDEASNTVAVSSHKQFTPEEETKLTNLREAIDGYEKVEDMYPEPV